MLKRLFLIFTLFCSGLAHAQAVPVDTVRAWMNYLAGDGLRGRANGSVEIDLAARYIAASFAESGLTPPPGSNGYLQAFQFTSRRDGRLIQAKNVVGFIEGSHSELKKECIIVCAHYDHLGIGKAVEGDSIYNGADDNASGTAAVMGVARALQMTGIRPARSILFVAWAGEEMGIQGSRYYVQHPLWPLDQTVLVINFELLGRPETIGLNRYYVTGASFSDFNDIMAAYNKDEIWKIDNRAAPVDRLMFASDNAAFASVHRKERESWGIVAHTLAMEAGGDHVHTVHDSPDLCNMENLARFVDYMNGVINHLAGLETQPVWTNSSFHPLSQYRK